MKKFLTVAMAAAALSMTAGCGLIPQSAPAPTVTVQAENTESAKPSESADPVESSKTTEPTKAAKDKTTGLAAPYTYEDFMDGKISDDAFVKYVRANTTALTDVGDGAIKIIPGKACAALANGDTFKTILSETGESLEVSIEMTTNAKAVYTEALGNDAGFIIGAGVMNYCPEYEEDLKAAIPHTNQ